jgi:hypothetical protein
MNDIRVGILTNEMTAPAWVRDMLRMSVAQDGVKVSLVVHYSVDSGDLPRARNSADARLLDTWLAIDKNLVKVVPDAFETVDLSPVLSGVPTLTVGVDEGDRLDHFRPEDVARIQPYCIDVFLMLGTLRPSDDILNSASCGVWFFQHGDGLRSQQNTVGVQDILMDSADTASSLQWWVAGSDRAHTLQQSWSMTYPFSIHRNRSFCYWKTLSFFPRKLRELRSLGAEAFRQKYTVSDARSVAVIRQQQSTRHAARHVRQIAQLITRIAASKLSNLMRSEQWILLFQFGDDAMPECPQSFTQLIPPRDRFWADPFVFQRDGEYVVFLEELEYAKKKGHLAVIRFDADRRPILPAIKILERPYHLSYPFLIEHAGELYMIPETHQSRAIELYRCSRFPDKWEFVMNLMEDVMAVDTTIWQHQGKFWMFAGMRDNEHASLSDELCLYSSDSLLTQNWKPHPCNPIVSDVRCARPAGNIFEYRGDWYRPAQDCSGKYGRALTFQRIDLIDEESYRETQVSRVDADWDSSIDRVHTFNRTGDLSFIDGMKIHRKLRAPAGVGTQ